MTRTPDVLQKSCAIPADLGEGRPFPRVFTAFRGTHQAGPCSECQAAGKRCSHVRANPQKFEFLSTLMALVTTGAIPGEGQPRKFSRAVTQQQLAARSGLRQRSSFTRRISKLAPAVDSPRRRRPANPLPLVQRDRRFAEANRYGFFQLPERHFEFWIVEAKTGRVEGRKVSEAKARSLCTEKNRAAGRLQYEVQKHPVTIEDYHAPALEQLLQDPRTAGWWDAGWNFAEGYKHLPPWLFDERLVIDRGGKRQPLSDTARVVMATYFLCGLQDHDPKRGKHRGVLHVHQDHIARITGLSVKSVYNANRDLEKIGLVRIAHRRMERKPEGGWASGPQIVVYLPERQLTEQEAQVERLRFRMALQRVLRALQGAQQEKALAQAHEALLTAWTGKEHSLRAFWNEYCRLLASQGVDREILRRLVPLPPP